ncbi:MAG: DUF2730 family protein [Emcibacter sp.]|nr:DUF2730 family protein [Emcibacter sp.]
MGVLEILRSVWLVASGVLLFAVFVLMLMARDKFVSKKDHEKLEAKVAMIKERLIAAETALENVPRTDTMHELSLSIERMNGTINVMSAIVSGMEKFSKSMSSTIARQEEHLLNASKGK